MRKIIVIILALPLCACVQPKLDQPEVTAAIARCHAAGMEPTYLIYQETGAIAKIGCAPRAGF